MTPFLQRVIIGSAIAVVATVGYIAARSRSDDGGTISTAPPNTRAISAAQYGDSYPFTVDGELICTEQAIALKVGGDFYPINGTARSKLTGAKPLEDIWKPDPATGGRVNLGQVLSDGQKLCQ